MNKTGNIRIVILNQERQKNINTIKKELDHQNINCLPKT